MYLTLEKRIGNLRGKKLNGEGWRLAGNYVTAGIKNQSSVLSSMFDTRPEMSDKVYKHEENTWETGSNLRISKIHLI